MIAYYCTSYLTTVFVCPIKFTFIVIRRTLCKDKLRRREAKVTVQFERCFRLMEHVSVISCRNPINLNITKKLIKFSKSLFNFYLVISNI